MSEVIGSRRIAARRGKKLAEQVAQEIVQDISRARMVPGDRLPSEVIMAQTYGISRSSLREALRILEVHGLITIKSGPGGGPELARIGAQDFGRMATLFFHTTGVTFRQLLDARCIFEPMIAELAAKNQPQDLMTKLKENIATHGDYKDIEVLAGSSHNFHAIIADMAGNQILSLVTSSLHGIFSVYSQDTYTAKSLAAIVRVHERIATAIENGDSAEARRLMENHMQASADDFERKHPTLVDAPVPWLST